MPALCLIFYIGRKHCPVYIFFIFFIFLLFLEKCLFLVTVILGIVFSTLQQLIHQLVIRLGIV